MDLNDPARLLQTVWQIPGRLHPRMPLGRISQGHIANLAVWDLDHPAFWPGSDPLRALAFGNIGGALDGLWVNGRLVGELGSHAQSLLQSPHYKACREEADARLQALLRKIGIC